nr:MAG TPA: YopX protein [Caudoviricetes sp.]
MRQIKFRAWFDSKMWEVVQMGFNPNGSSSVTLYCNGELLFKDDDTDVVFMQYTGLKDKNGKEIYDGDIVSVKYIYDKRTTDKAQVVWREDKACFGLKSLKGLTNEAYELYKITAEHNLEVIGNIYENKELLNE